MRLHIDHVTSYRYTEPVNHSVQCIRLSPYQCKNYVIDHWSLECPGSISQYVDGFGNHTHIVTVDSPHHELSVRVTGIVDIDIEAAENSCDTSHYSRDLYLRHTSLTQSDAHILDYSQHILGSRPSLDDLHKLMVVILQDMPYTPGSTDVSDTAGQAFAKRAGVCQDHTHVFLSCCRNSGIPARYVSGYIHSSDEEHVATHAWAEAWINGGWHSFDITNQLTKLDHHLKLAIGLDYLDACPVRGVRFGGSGELMESKALVYKTHLLEQ